MKHFLATIILIVVSNLLFAQLPKPQSGKVVRLDNFKSSYVDSRNVDIWLPDSYSTAKKYAVLYMHDGQMLYDSTVTWNKKEWKVDETIATLVKEGKIKDVIVVGIWNNGQYRHAEYFPQKAIRFINKKDKEELMKLLAEKPQADNYLKFIVYELKPYIDSNYSTLQDQQNTYIMGSSMGGLISMYAICEYPNIFGGAGCLSTHWVGNFSTDKNNPIPNAIVKYMKKNLPSPNMHKIYFDYGTKTLDSLYEPSQKKVDELMRRKGYNSQCWITRKFEGEDHSENAWQRRLNIPIEFLLHSQQASY